MNPENQPDHVTCDAIVFRQDGSALLLNDTENGLILPQVDIPRYQRFAESLTTGMRDKWDCEAICLFSVEVARGTDDVEPDRYPVMEFYRDRGARATTQWVLTSQLSQCPFRHERDYRAVLQALKHCAEAVDEGQPFSRLGWLSELQTWISGVMRPLGVELDGSFRQFNASPTFSLIRFGTNGTAVWFKAVGHPNLRELPVTLTLARIFPAYVCRILGVRPACNGWLSLEAKGMTLADFESVEAWSEAAAKLASLQIDSIGHQQELLDSGARSLTCASLSELVVPFFTAVSELMQRQQKTPPSALTAHELRPLQRQIQNALSALADLRIPQTLGQLDLNPGNIVVSPGNCVFLDWAEAYVGHPFFSLEYLLQHFRSTIGGSAPLASRVTNHYAAGWHKLISPQTLRSAMALTPLIAVFAYAVMITGWREPDKLRCRIAAYLRSLARRMKREADRLIGQEAACLG